MPVDQDKLHTFLVKAVTDIGAAASAVLMSIGDDLGFYKALAETAMTPAELARKTGTHERYVREWLANQAAGGYVEYDRAAGKYSLNAEQALCLADPKGPVDIPGAYLLIQDMFHVRARAMENFRTAKAWNGANTTIACSTAPNDSSAPATTPICWGRGSPPWTASRKS